METPGLRFSPDNSPEACAKRVIAYDHALAWVTGHIIQKEIKPPETDDKGSPEPHTGPSEPF